MYCKAIALSALLLCAAEVTAQTAETADSLSLDSLMKTLPEVTVKGQRPIVKAERGKLSYNMPLLLKQLSADNAYEALTRIPGVSDQNGSFMFSGSAVTLIVNGKPTTLTQEQLVERLKAMPAAQLAKVEVMLSAPAKYHVRGMAINIVTKDFAGTNQLSGQVVGAWTHNKYNSGTGRGNLYWQKGKFGLDAQYAFTGGSSYAEVEHRANHPFGTERIPYWDKTENEPFGTSHNYRLGLNYAFKPNHRLDVAYTGKWDKSCSTNRTTGTSTSNQHSDEHEYLHNIEADYSMPFALHLSGSYTRYRTPQQQKLVGSILQENKDYITESRQTIDTWMFSADQEHQFGKGWGISYGVKGQFTGNNSYQRTKDAQGNFVPDATRSIDNDERIWNLYGGVSKQVSQALSLEASVEAEQYHSSVWDKWRVYPSFNALWVVNKDNVMNLSFSSDSQFPNYWSTMSSVFYSSTYSEIWGNPKLKPYSSYSLNLMWQFRGNYSLMAFANFRPDYFVQLPYQPSDRVAVVMQETNFDYSNEIGLQASASFSAGRWLGGNVFAVGTYRRDKSSAFFDLPFDRSKLTAILGGNVSVKFCKGQDLRLMLNPFFQSQAIQGVYDIEPLFMMNARLSWTSKNGKWGLRLNGNNIFNERFDTQSVQGNQDFRMKVAQNWASATFSVVYKFGGYKEKKVKEVDTSRLGH